MMRNTAPILAYRNKRQSGSLGLGDEKLFSGHSSTSIPPKIYVFLQCLQRL